MSIQLIALDLDGTLLNSDKKISPRNKEALKRAADKGVKLILCTGRASSAVKDYVEELGIREPVITFQGSKIIDTVTGEMIYEKGLGPEEILPMLTLCEEEGIHCNLYMDDAIYIEKEDEEIAYYKRFAPNTEVRAVGKLSEFIKKPTTKLLMMASHERLEEIRPRVAELLSPGMDLFYSSEVFLEVVNKAGNKGNGVKFIAEEYYGLSQNEVMTFGDHLNDLSMIQYAGLGVAMANGEERLKQEADYVTLSNDDDGVAFAIEKFVLNNNITIEKKE